MLSAQKKDQIINNRGESQISSKSSNAYTVVLTDRSFPMISMSGKSADQLTMECASKFGDTFLRLDHNG